MSSSGVGHLDQVDRGEKDLHRVAQVVHQRAGHLAEERHLLLAHDLRDVELVGAAQHHQHVLDEIDRHGHRFAHEHVEQVGRRDPRHGGAAARAGVGAAALAVEHGDLAEEVARVEDRQRLPAAGGRLHAFDLALQHEANALRAVALAKEVLAVFQFLVDQVPDEPLLPSRGEELQEPV
ncbi:MAG: hypothetical protein WDO13_01085 [Verrucomicrobiota bacterium]